jgi:hypothetical protein
MKKLILLFVLCSTLTYGQNSTALKITHLFGDVYFFDS